MDRKIFIVRQKDYDVGIIIIDEEGECLYGKILDPERMPFSKTEDERSLFTWWRERSIPENRQKLYELLSEYGCSTPQELLLKNWGLSLTDTYWICPEEYKELKYADVNLFDHGNEKMIFHSGYGRVHYTGSANAATGGTLDKRAVKRENEWYLEKKSGTGFPDGQQNVNELFVSYMHKLQECKEYTPYSVSMKEDGNRSVCEKSICKFFTSKDIELITADQLSQMYSRDNLDEIKNTLDGYIRTCSLNGLDYEYVQKSLDYMMLMDYVTTNSDRHWSNFGILRDPDTLKYISIAPIYDNGNSMFYNVSYELSRLSLARLEDNGITKNEIDRLSLIRNKNLVKADMLPSPSEVKEFYIKYGIQEERAEIISRSYSHKLDMFLEFTHGMTISISHEIEGYNDGPPYIEQKPNLAYCKDHTENDPKSEKSLIDVKENLKILRDKSKKENIAHKSTSIKDKQVER